MKTLDQRRSIDAYKLNHTAKVIKKFVPQGSILEQLMNFAELMRHISKSYTLLIRFLAQKWKKFDFKEKITIWNTAKETCPIRTESGKGAFVIFFSLNERAVGNKNKIINFVWVIR